MNAFKQPNDLIIDAKAGTGKTTTLKKLASLVPNSSILYLVFNKKNQIEAQKEFPGNTKVMTTNSFCGSVVNQMFKSKYKEYKTMLLIPKNYYVCYDKSEQGKYKSQTCKIIDKCKAHNCPPNNVELINAIIQEFVEEENKVEQKLMPTS